MRAVLIGFVLALIVASPAWPDTAQDQRNCGPKVQLADACTRLLRSGRFNRSSMSILYSNRCLAFSKLNRFQQAIPDCNEAIRLNPQNVYGYVNRCLAFNRLKQYQRAMADCNQAIRLNPRFAITYYNRGVAFTRLKQYQKAIADYSQAIRLNPRLAPAYINRGIAYRRLKRYQQAMSDFNQTLRLNPRYALGYYNRGNVYLARKQYRKAIADYSQAASLNPLLVNAYNNRGIAYRKLKQYRQAMSDFNQTLRLSPRYALGYYNRGNVYLALKQYQRAIADYSQAIRLNPRYGPAYFNRGLINQYIYKNRRQAVSDYRAAYKLNPSRSVYATKLREMGIPIPPKVSDTGIGSEQRGERRLTLNADVSGHFYVVAKLNGKPVRLLVDTGATSTVLSQSDAGRVGISLSGLQYNRPVRTANGVVSMALTNISKFQVGRAVFWNVRVLISPRMSGSVLGVRTLRRFKSYTVAGDTLTLRW